MKHTILVAVLVAVMTAALAISSAWAQRGSLPSEACTHAQEEHSPGVLFKEDGEECLMLRRSPP